MKVHLTRRLKFSAAHRLCNDDLNDDENRKIYGKCFNPAGHGHNYILEITVQGEVSGDTGMIYELKQLKDLIWENLLKYIDHKHLNYDVPFLKGVIPTAENLVIAFWRRLEPLFPPGMLYRLKLVETDNNWVEYYGD